METNTIEKEEKDDEISLIDLFAVLLRYKVMIIVITLVAIIGVVSFSIISLLLPPEKSPLPNVFTPKAIMLINDQNSSGGGSSSLSSSGLSTLAGLMGVSVSQTSTYGALATYLMGTNTILDAVTDEFDLIRRWKIKKFPRASSRKQLKKTLVAEMDENEDSSSAESAGIFTIQFSDKDPVFAQRVVNFCVDLLQERFLALGLDKNKREKDNLEINIKNCYEEIQRLEMEAHTLEFSVQGMAPASIPSIGLELNRINLELESQKQVYTQLKVQYELAKVALASETPVFQILERPEVPDMKSKPSRGILCIIVTFAAGFFAVFLAFLLNAIANVKKDPEAMAKLGGRKKPQKETAREHGQEARI